jgi:hypothetical protein
MRLNKKGKALIYTAIVVTAAVAISILVWYLLQPKYTLNSEMIIDAPVLDGKDSDPAWAAAKPVNIPTERSGDISVKSVYSPEMIYFLVRFKSATPVMAEHVWEFDGKNWKQGKASDQLGMFFEMKNSIPEFRKKGFGAMNFGLKDNEALWEFGTIGPKNLDKPWTGAKQEADYWFWGIGIAKMSGKAEDLFYSINREYVLSSLTTTPVLMTRLDDFKKQAPFLANSVAWQNGAAVAEGSEVLDPVTNVPALTYVKGKNVINDPYPFFEDLTPITATSTYKKGDKLPYIYFDSKTKGRWGGSVDDVEARGSWKDGYWTVELRRRLNTGNADDIRLAAPKDKVLEYWFGAVTRTGGKVDKSAAARLRLIPDGGN